ncbi:TolC family protein [Chitinimonas sp.]|uniref:TolC family protein n=1 Tax=Chitinimonas sp. TaxID=1934313 RepID=UPI0035B1CEB7
MTRLFPCCLALLALAASAETLEDAWRAAESGNPALQAEQAGVTAAQARQRAAAALDWPVLSLSAGYLHLSDAPTSSVDLSPLGHALAGTPLAPIAARLPGNLSLPLAERDISAGSLALSYPLYSGGRISATQRAAAAGLDLAQANQQRARQQLRLDIAEAYLNVLRADAAAQVAERYRSGLAAHRNDVAAMEKQGLAAPVERMTADVALADAARRQIDARQTQELACAAYNRLLNRSLDAEVQLQALPANLLGPLAADGEQALKQRPELAALTAGETALHQQAEAARGADRPQLALSAMHLRWRGLSTEQDRTNAIGVVMNWSLFDGGLARQQAAALQQDASALAARRDDARSLVLLDVKRASLAERAAIERQGVSQSAEQLAAEALRLSQARYREGLANQTEVLAAETRRADAERARHDADFDLQLARLKLRRAMGAL